MGGIMVLLLLIITLHVNLGHGDANMTMRCTEKEREALLAFKQGLIMDEYSQVIFSSWGTEAAKQDCCRWKGVSCDNQTGHVVQLDLRDHYYSSLLQGTMISPKLIELKHLEYLYLSWIDYSGSPVPYFIGSLTNLRYLDLSMCKFGGTFPIQIGNLTNLQHLDLGGNEFGNVENLNWLPRLSSLTYLDLSLANLSNIFYWLEAVNKLPKLTTLELDGCNLPSPPVRSTLSNINSSKSLSSISLSGNRLSTSSIFLWMSNFNTSLFFVDLSFNNLTGSIPDVLGNMSSLASVALYENQLEGAEPHSFSRLCSLQSLILNSNNLSGQFSKFVQILPTCAQNSLENLWLAKNQLAGSLPDLTNFLALKELYISSNQLSGRIPESIGQMSKLELIDLGMNALEGVISDSHFSKLSKLRQLDLSYNSVVLNFHSNWTPPFQLDYISLGSCKMGPYFPKWLQSQNEYSHLDISNAGIVDTLPSWFWGTTRNVRFVSLSHNQIGEMFTNFTLDFANYIEVHLSSNEIEGQIPATLSEATYLDLSNNNISGSISFLCASATMSLNFLNLSYNNLSGELPECLTHFYDLVVLDLSYNAFSGEIPSTIGSLYHMITLKLRSNRFVGELPSSFKNCTSLQVIDVGNNKLSGRIPKWLGASLHNLVILMLFSNNFNGSMPSELCGLTNILNLDVSANNISGTIPKCLNNLTVLAHKGYSSPTLQHLLQNSHGYAMDTYMDDATFIWKGSMHSYRNILGLVKRIDFSSNRLTGKIPSEITDLVGLVSLNLSRNRLTGEIPAKIGELQSLDALDLSRNQIDGRIPMSLARIDRLSFLDLSYNNFIGRIPTGTQLQSFDPSVYAGNRQLCGPPLQMCGNQQETLIPSNEEEKDDLITWGFYVSMGLGFIVGFWGVCGSLIFIRPWRYSYFRFLNVLNDWFYVRVISIKRHFN
ncbi:LRR receptor-like serine/threonine-protein kinase GSO2 [Pyrus ussuriensis x Pyrus communis]|uniref:LRR receptor-like serine/threonine-protein kinase GSO2 n=1 Tax=Pyrus ussuriensis x Pyrus communis TaxID=2448454 RepID=A0A5N5HCK4_9ROSA|nr:LRR receptor-like serine/threonine-protein kinase GSO2 [Pyrus ussuriensis x Pyrus communis]